MTGDDQAPREYAEARKDDPAERVETVPIAEARGFLGDFR